MLGINNLLYFFVSIVIPVYSYAYNGSDCRNYLFGKDGGYNRLGISTSQFISSTGACSAIGMNREEQAQLFYVNNYDKVMEDIARGRGEYYLTISGMWGCRKEDALNKIHPLRQGYPLLLKLDEEGQYNFIKKYVKCSMRGNLKLKLFISLMSLSP